MMRCPTDLRKHYFAEMTALAEARPHGSNVVVALDNP
jgi:hypothetical protein